MTPVITGLIAIGYGILFGFWFCLVALVVYLNPPEAAPPIARLVPALLTLMGGCSVMLLPSGVGVLLHRQWGKSLTHSMSLGLIVSAGLGSALALTNLPLGYGPDVIGLFLIGFVTGIFAAAVLGLLFRTAVMRSIFDNDTQQTDIQS